MDFRHYRFRPSVVSPTLQMTERTCNSGWTAPTRSTGFHSRFSLARCRWENARYGGPRSAERRARSAGAQPSRTRLDEQRRMALPWVLDQLKSYARYEWGHKKVTAAGCLRLLSRHLYLNEALAGQQVYLLRDYRKWLKLASWKRDWAIPEDLQFEPHDPVVCPRIAVS